MNIAFGIVFLLFFCIISYPLLKNFQLCGYDIKHFAIHAHMLPYEFKGKNKLVFTKRMMRLAAIYVIILSAVTMTYFLLLKQIWWIILCAIIEFLLLNEILLICAIIISPIEKLIKDYYINRARKILKNFKGKKIAITGSFGKTSTKNFLTHILGSTYKVCATPKNYNTPMGLCKTALKVLKKEDEVLIAEMGARHKGDIAFLMQMLQPSFGIVTAIGEQHLETFGSLENIKAAKYELCSHIGKEGVVIFDCDSDNTLELYKKFAGKKYKSCEIVKIKPLFCSYNGTKLEIIIGDQIFHASTKIIGKALINDVELACAMAKLLGVSDENIIKSIKTLLPAPHRLELIKNKFCTVIDDSYNSNLEGARQACECLSLFKGKKIIVSPGLVEQGDKQYELNFKLGKIFGESADELIIMNETNKKPLTEGALTKIDKSRIHHALSREGAQEVLKSLQDKGCVILFENDLPDNYK